MKAVRITTNELLDLADHVTRLASKAGHVSQQPVQKALDACLPLLIDAAKGTALQEAMDVRRLREDEQQMPAPAGGVGSDG